MHNSTIVFIEANVARLLECPMPEPNSGEVRVRAVEVGYGLYNLRAADFWATGSVQNRE